MQGRNPDQEDIKLQQQIQRIYGCLTLQERLNPKAVEKAKELMMIYLKQIVGEALNKSICRDGTSTQLEQKDLLAVIRSKGDIYKFKIVRTLLLSKNWNQVNQKPTRESKTMKQEEQQFNDD